MIVESMATSLAVGKVRGGKLTNLSNFDLKGWYLFLIGYVIETVSVIINMNNFLNLSIFLEKYFLFIHSLSYFFIFIGLILNFKIKSLKIIFIGTLLNYIVILTNGGKMPVSEGSLKCAGLHDTILVLKSNSFITHTFIDKTTKLSFLGDIIPLPKPYPFAKVISIGDVFLGVGIFILIQKLMFSKDKDKN